MKPSAAPIPLDTLPIAEILPALRAALDSGTAAVIQAPPGAGKTTAVPLALLDCPWRAGRRILMLEPRRLAARMAARRMAVMLGEEVGATVGYRVRQDSRVSAATRVEVVTEGVLTRMLQADPDLPGVACVIFDEFHERSLHADLGLTLCLEVRAALRDDLRLVVMSATLDAAPVAALLGDAPVITSQGRAYAVETRFLTPRPRDRLEDTMAAAVRTALAEETGSVLAFLPGEGEIRRVAERLRGLPPDVDVAPLFGALPPEAQDRAVRPAAAGRRKVVLATAIAETSLTIDGIRVVIDGGQTRRAAFDPRSGMTRLVTARVTRASADQRRGRAGRLMPGVCYRLWSEAEDRALLPAPPPEITDTDLAPLVLDLAAWGSVPDDLAWLDAPPPAAVAQARDLLTRLGGLDAAGRITAHGRAMAELPLHPRLAHMVLAARTHGLGGLACDVAALLGERDPVKARDADLRLRLDLLHGAKPGGLTVDRGVLARARQDAATWRRRLGLDAAQGTSGAGVCLALAYPDRIGRRRGEGFTLSGGRGAVLSEGDPLAAEDFLAVGDLDAGAANARIYLAAPLTRTEIEDTFADAITETDEVAWDSRSESVVARRRQRLGACVLEDRPLPAPDPSRLAEGLIDGIRRTGLHVLPWDRKAEQVRARIAFLRAAPSGDDWPDMSDAALLATLDDWLAPFLGGMSKLAHLRRLTMVEVLTARLSWDQRQRLDREAPTHFAVPTGSRIPLDYSTGETPVLAVRLQEMFGCTVHPAIAGGRVPLVVHLLSPAHRPIQVTQDLPGFWTSSYAAVKADMKGRYPKHPWPDDPIAAPPTSRAKRRGE